MNYALDYSNKNAFITGAASGIGFETANAFLSCGADVFLSDCNVQQLNDQVKKLKNKYPERKIIAITADNTNPDDIQNLINTIEAYTDKIHILVNNAGTSRKNPSLNETRDEWNKIIELNLTSQFFIAQNIAKSFMVKSKYGRIINIASLAGILGHPSAAAYSASKGALIQLTKTLAAEWAEHNITVNAVCPGFVETPLIKNEISNRNWMTYMLMLTPLRRLAKVEDIAGAVLYLGSDMSSYITGQTLIVDGGFSCGS